MTATEIDELGPVGYLVVGLSAARSRGPTVQVAAEARGPISGRRVILASEQETKSGTALEFVSNESLGRRT